MVEQMRSRVLPFDVPLKGLSRKEVLMPFEYQAMLILIACLVPVAFLMVAPTTREHAAPTLRMMMSRMPPCS